MNHFQRYLIEEFAEDYQEGQLSRRDALKLITGVTGSIVIANSILAACTPSEEFARSPENPTPSESLATGSARPTAIVSAGMVAPKSGSYGTVDPEDPEIDAGDIEFTGEGATLLGYQAMPAQTAGKKPVILVCHENRGLTEHIKDVTRRLGKAGYAALAVDLLSRHGGTSSLDPSEVPGILGNTPPDQFVQDFYSGWHYLQGLPTTQADRVGMVGFCFGGGVTWLMATRMPELKAAVPYYGPNPPLDDVPKIQAAVLAIYGANDQRINAAIPEIEAAMRKSNKIFEKIIYPNAGHAFNNDTSDRYAPEAARDAWMQTLAWFGKYV
jgi:carboxymethylenebutenolidase